MLYTETAALIVKNDNFSYKHTNSMSSLKKKQKNNVIKIVYVATVHTPQHAIA